MRQIRFLFFLILMSILSTGFGCLGDAAADRVMHLRADSESEELGFESGSRVHLDLKDRQALLMIVDGVLDSNGDHSIELDYVIDADVFVSRNSGEGDPHWITRAKVLDEQGEELWTQRVNSLFQLIEFLNLILEQQSDINLGPEQVYSLVKPRFPELLQFALKVPIGIEGGTTYVLELSQEGGSWLELGSYEIADLIAQAEPPSVDAELARLVESGPVEDRINVAIIGDGYNIQQRHLFEGDAQAVADRFLATSPMTEHADLFNITSIWTPSEEAGAGYDCNHGAAPAGCEQRFRDTVYETAFVIPAIIDELNIPLGEVSDRVAMPRNLAKVFETASLASYDEIILISNSAKRSGFAGLYVALVTSYDARLTFPDVAVHEVGHTLGLLGDEYMVAGDACYYNEPYVPLPANIGELVDGQIKWSDWLEEDTPLPTPDSMADEHLVGAYQGAYNCSDLVRPSHRCMMKRSGDDFCPICAEQMVRRFYSFVDPSPHQEFVGLRLAQNEIRLRAPVRDSDRYEVQWTVNGVPTFEGSSYRLNAGDLPEIPNSEWVSVEATVRNSSGIMRTRDDSVENYFRMEIKLEDRE